jgi:hypothetical protein
MIIYRMIPLAEVETLRARFKAQGLKVRVRYRGPHGPHCDTLKKDARAATIYVE